MIDWLHWLLITSWHKWVDISAIVCVSECICNAELTFHLSSHRRFAETLSKLSSGEQVKNWIHHCLETRSSSIFYITSYSCVSHTYILDYTYISLYMNIYVHIHACMCYYLRIYMCIYRYTRTFMFMHINMCLLLLLLLLCNIHDHRTKLCSFLPSQPAMRVLGHSHRLGANCPYDSWVGFPANGSLLWGLTWWFLHEWPI